MGDFVRMNLIIEKYAKRFMERQPMNQRARLLRAIHCLPSGDIKPLKGHDGVFRLRVGDFRIVFHIDETKNEIFIREIGNRGDIYK